MMENSTPSKQTITIREATFEDIPAIAQVHVNTWRTAYRDLLPAEFLANLSYQKREQNWHTILNEANSNGVFIYVAETSESAITPAQIIGFAVGAPERSGDRTYLGELTAIYILQAYQKLGIGKRLVQAVAKHLERMELHSMLIWVLAENPACQFYEQLGGQRLQEKEIVIGGTALIEVAYGWNDLSDLTRF